MLVTLGNCWNIAWLFGCPFFFAVDVLLKRARGAREGALTTHTPVIKGVHLHPLN